MSSTLIHSCSCSPSLAMTTKKENPTRPRGVFHFLWYLSHPPRTRGKCMIRPPAELNCYFSCDKWNCFARGACHARERFASLCRELPRVSFRTAFETSLLGLDEIGRMCFVIGSYPTTTASWSDETQSRMIDKCHIVKRTSRCINR